MFGRTIIAALAILTASAASAYTLRCDLSDQRESGGWVPTQVALAIDEAAGTMAFVGLSGFVDAFEFAGGSVIEAAERRLDASVEAITRSCSTQRARMLYRLTWIKGTDRATLQAVPLGYSNRFVARGACARR